MSDPGEAGSTGRAGARPGADFEALMDEIVAEAEAEGPEAVAELEALSAHFRRARTRADRDAGERA